MLTCIITFSNLVALGVPRVSSDRILAVLPRCRDFRDDSFTFISILKKDLSDRSQSAHIAWTPATPMTTPTRTSKRVAPARDSAHSRLQTSKLPFLGVVRRGEPRSDRGLGEPRLPIRSFRSPSEEIRLFPRLGFESGFNFLDYVRSLWNYLK